MTTQESVFTFYSDPGHGWVAVPKALLRDLGIAGRITPYSYQRGATAFLEEDCDASTFIVAMKAAGRPFKFDERHDNRDSFIRALDTYREA
jgi:hypothetical protein